MTCIKFLLLHADHFLVLPQIERYQIEDLTQQPVQINFRFAWAVTSQTL